MCSSNNITQPDEKNVTSSVSDIFIDSGALPIQTFYNKKSGMHNTGSLYLLLKTLCLAGMSQKLLDM